jgi:hypothetical protein
MNPLTALTSCCRSISYDYGTKTGRIDVRTRVTHPCESYVYACQVIDPGVQTIEVLRAETPRARHVRGDDRRWRSQEKAA